MKVSLQWAVSWAIAAAIAVAVFAGEPAKEVQLTGNIACGKCSLHVPDLKKCQDVLVVPGDGGKTTEYWLVKNEVFEAFGHTCQGEKAATVTGSVVEKDGAMWLTPTKIEAAAKG